MHKGTRSLLSPAIRALRIRLRLRAAPLVTCLSSAPELPTGVHVAHACCRVRVPIYRLDHWHKPEEGALYLTFLETLWQISFIFSTLRFLPS